MMPPGKFGPAKILFISSNDGSDMRINKEIKSLHNAGAEVFFIGVESHSDNCFVRPYCQSVYLISGRRNSPVTLLKMMFMAMRISIFRSINSIHIINEQLMIFFYPLLFFKYTVLDIFDSVFLKFNQPGNSLKFLKRLVYLPIDKILVTDERRLQLMPDFARKRCSILPNFPYKRKTGIGKTTGDKLCIIYNGWMGKNRGTEIIEGLLSTGLPVKIIMAGWFSDEDTRNLVKKHPESIDFRGVVPQETALNWAENESDYILCVYAPVNENNINASPNKIYDAIHTGTPIITNREIGIAKFVDHHKLGVVLPSYHCEDFFQLYQLLMENRNSFSWDHNLMEQYSWENSEETLLKCHKLK